VKTIYLAGPIWKCTDKECQDWRSLIKTEFSDKFCFLDPMRRDYRANAWLPQIAEEIVHNDRRDIIESDILLANTYKQSSGTAMEIFFAWTLEKEIWILNPDFPMISPWLIHHGDFFFCKIEQILNYLRLIK
jgi:nucleoside 2-deoxyribosyltransferase